MEELFRQKLKLLQVPDIPTDFAEALLNIQSFYPHFSKEEVKPTLITSEKKNLIQSLQQFVAEKHSMENESMKIEGGEIVMKEQFQALQKYSHPQEVVTELSAEITKKIFTYFHSQKVKILFAVDKLQPSDQFDLSDESELGCLKIFFPEKVAELFQRMIKAMGLNSQDYFLYPLDEEQGFSKRAFYEVALSIKPVLVVTLGAKTTKVLLNTEERLTTLHGQFLPYPIDQHNQLLYVPLFHPSILESNANMKKSAWVDMQKMMDYLKKSI